MNERDWLRDMAQAAGEPPRIIGEYRERDTGGWPILDRFDPARYVPIENPWRLIDGITIYDTSNDDGLDLGDWLDEDSADDDDIEEQLEDA